MAGKRKRTEAEPTETAAVRTKKSKIPPGKGSVITIPKIKIGLAYAKKYTPAKLLNVPWEDRWKLNLEKRDFPEGELELERKPMAWHITWLVQYTLIIGQDSYIFFYSQQERYGGPFAFLSNFYLSKFRAPGLAHEFDCLEQFYQYKKATSMLDALEKATNLGPDSVSSLQQLPEVVLNTKEKPLECADHVRGLIDCLKKEDPQWWNEWAETWDAYSILKEGIHAKFTSDNNKHLKQLLMMTGDFRLVEAHHECSTSIGITAADAVKRIKKWGANLLGRALEAIRTELRAGLGASQSDPLPGYAYEFWRAWEEMSNEKRYISLWNKRTIEERKTWSAKLPDSPQRPPKVVMPELEKIRNSWPVPIQSPLLNLPKA